jgi:hypothetical protein
MPIFSGKAPRPRSGCFVDRSAGGTGKAAWTLGAGANAVTPKFQRNLKVLFGRGSIRTLDSGCVAFRAQGAARSPKSSYNMLRGRCARAGLGPALGDPDVSRSLPICCGKGAGSLERELKSRASHVKGKAQISNLKPQISSTTRQASGLDLRASISLPLNRGDAGQPGPRG